MSAQGNIFQCPEPVETSDLHFKLVNKIKVFEGADNHPPHYTNYLAVAPKFGLLFVGSRNGFQVLKTKSAATSDPEQYPRQEILLKWNLSHLCVSSDQLILAVGCFTQHSSHAYLYSVASFTTQKVAVLRDFQLPPNPDAGIRDLVWNKGENSALLTCCLTDGSVGLVELLPMSTGIKSLPASTQATCLCWSPKGKQIVIGCDDGTLSQYKPDLKHVKTLSPPPLFDNFVTTVNVLWISNYQFAVVYKDKRSAIPLTSIVIVNAVKNDPIQFINYEDITYSNTLFRSHQVYLSHQTLWNLILVSSSNSMEVAVLHAKEDNTTWEQWLLGDASRAELPLDSNQQETFPLGLAFDVSSDQNLPWGEGFIPPMPRLFFLSHEGILLVYNVINLNPNVPQICSPPATQANDALFTIKPKASAMQPLKAFPVAVAPSPVAAVIPEPTPTPIAAPIVPVVPSVAASTAPSVSFPQSSILGTPPQPNANLFGGAKPTFSFGANNTFTPLASSAPATQLLTPKPNTAFQMGTPNALNTSSASSFQLAATPQLTQATTTQPVSFPIFDLQTSVANQTKLFSKTPTAALQVAKPSAEVSKPVEKTPVVGSIAPQQIAKQSFPPVVSPQTNWEPSSEAAPTTVTKSPALSEVASPPKRGKVDTVYVNAIMDVIEDFNSQLQESLQRMKTLNVSIAIQEEKDALREKINNLEEFWTELKETTAGLGSEIHAVKEEIMESFAWLENARSRNQQRKNPSYVHLKRAEELDPISSRHMNEIEHLKYYVESQLKQINTHLDKEWMEHQDIFRQDVKSKMAIPSMEDVYKTMNLHLKILNKQRIIIDELKGKISEKYRQAKAQPNFMVSPTQNRVEQNRSSELSKLAENLLHLKINQDEKIPMSGIESYHLMMKAKVKSIAERTKKLTPEKQAVLRDVLGEHDMTKIRPVKTSFDSSSFIRSHLTSSKSCPTSTLRSSVKIINSEQESVVQPNTVQQPVEMNQSNFSANLSFRTAAITSTPLKTAPLVPVVPVVPAVQDLKVINEAVKSATLENKQPVKEPLQADVHKNIFTFGSFNKLEQVNSTTQEDPLNSLTGIVSKIGKEPETKSSFPTTSFTFSLPTSKPESSNVPFSFTTGLKLSDKSELPKTGSTISFPSFNTTKPTDVNLKAAEPKNEILNLSTPPSSKTASSKPFTFQPVPAVSATTTSSVVSLPASATPTTSKPLIKTGLFGSPTPTSTVSTNTGLTFGTVSSTQSSLSGFSFVPRTTGSAATTATSTTTSTSIFGSSGSNFSMFSTSAKGPQTPSIFGAPPSASISSGSTKSEESPVFPVKTAPISVTAPIQQENKTTTPTSGTQISFGPPFLTQKDTGEVEPSKITMPTTVAASTASQLPTTPLETQAVASSKENNSAITFTFDLSSALSKPTEVSSSFTTAGISATPVATVFASSPVAQAATASMSPVASVTGTVSASATPTITSTNTTTSGTGSIFSSKDIFATSSAPGVNSSVFGSPLSTTAPLFGQSEKTSLFGQAETIPTATSSIFGQPTSTSTNSSTASIFPTTSVTNSSIFSQTVATTPTVTASSTTSGNTGITTQNIFASAAATSAPSIFGQATAAPASTTSTTSTTSVASATSTPSIFGQTTAAPTSTTTNANIFGQVSSPTSTTASSFGQSDSVGQTASMFGQMLGGNLFGGSSTPATTTSNIFSKAVFDQNNASIFGGTAAATTTTSSSTASPLFRPSGFSQTSSIFGSPPTTTTTANVFGQPATTTSSSFFGQSICSPFGGSTTTSSAPFGTSTFANKSVFGQSPFSQSSSDNSNVFGGSSTNTSIFGGSNTSQNSGNIFQTSTANTFGSTSPGPFSSAGQNSVAQSGFGTPASFQKPLAGGFGSPPVFGSNAAAGATAGGFGASPTFSGAPTFGSPSAFGSPQKVFGSPQGNFGQSPVQSTAFENLANQNTVGFGNLAQQNQTSSAFGGSTFGSSTNFNNAPSFGGDSFSSWR